MTETPAWLSLTRGDAPLIVSMPHTGGEIPAATQAPLASPWLARKDADWWIDRLYDFVPALGATLMRTAISRTVIDVNRDPDGKSLYPGQNTTELCPTTTFDGEPLYRCALEPDVGEIASRRARYFDPYHAAIQAEIARLRQVHTRVVLFDAHSIRSRIPRLFDGELPHFNIGSNSGASCAGKLTAAVDAACAGTALSRVTNGRFKGGYTTRHYGDPGHGVHAVQLELAMRAYMDEPDTLFADNWPSPYEPRRAESLRATLKDVLQSCIRFARGEKP
ncbi:MAG TPA: N-formylglutamate deformylase [Rhizomicrobium sp.]